MFLGLSIGGSSLPMPDTSGSCPSVASARGLGVPRSCPRSLPQAVDTPDPVPSDVGIDVVDDAVDHRDKMARDRHDQPPGTLTEKGAARELHDERPGNASTLGPGPGAR